MATEYRLHGARVMRHVPGTVSTPLEPPRAVLQILVGKSDRLRNIDLTRQQVVNLLDDCANVLRQMIIDPRIGTDDPDEPPIVGAYDTLQGFEGTIYRGRALEWHCEHRHAASEVALVCARDHLKLTQTPDSDR